MKLSEVKIKSPCSNKLEKTGEGCSEYFCASCKNTVYDFRDATDEEFREISQQLGSDKCGIFYMDPEIPKPLDYLDIYSRSLPFSASPIWMLQHKGAPGM